MTDQAEVDKKKNWAELSDNDAEEDEAQEKAEEKAEE